MSQKAMVVAILNAAIAAGQTGDAFRTSTTASIQEGLANGTIPWSGDRTDPKATKSYAGALVSNYLKKEAHFHDGVPYKDRKTTRGPINKDATLKDLTENLKSLEATAESRTEHSDLIVRVKAAIEARKVVVDAEKATKGVKPLDEALASLATLLPPVIEESDDEAAS